mmetsp:Transcript_8587/g.17212  ORF Transcript_8587/g.17212 Transcript_8587/m.17212 type:complete len:209 (-) Transcript_8587:463-1089(-)
MPAPPKFVLSTASTMTIATIAFYAALMATIQIPASAFGFPSRSIVPQPQLRNNDNVSHHNYHTITNTLNEISPILPKKINLPPIHPIFVIIPLLVHSRHRRNNHLRQQQRHHPLLHHLRPRLPRRRRLQILPRSNPRLHRGLHPPGRQNPPRRQNGNFQIFPPLRAERHDQCRIQRRGDVLGTGPVDRLRVLVAREGVRVREGGVFGD